MSDISKRYIIIDTEWITFSSVTEAQVSDIFSGNLQLLDTYHLIDTDEQIVYDCDLVSTKFSPFS